jgi:hypothetical protein
MEKMALVVTAAWAELAVMVATARGLLATYRSPVEPEGLEVLVESLLPEAQVVMVATAAMAVQVPQ